MREILFKAKRKDNGEWAEGYLIADEQNEEKCFIGYVFGTNDDVTPHDFDVVAVDPSTICQCTGLKDKNGKLIWENDMVKYHFGNDVAHIKFGEYQSCFDSTKAGHIGFYLDWDCEKALRKDLGYWVNMIDCNIVGNTFDNPELLEGGTE